MKEQEDHGKSSLKKETIDKHVQDVKSYAKDNFEAMEERNRILDETKTMAQYETFLETAPQTVLQLYIIFQMGNSEVITWTQWRTLIKSFTFFLMGAMTNYLGPTKVSC